MTIQVRDAGEGTPADLADQAPVRRRRDRLAGVAARIRPHRLTGLGVFVALLAVLLVRNRFVFTHTLYDDGDFAVNAILIDEARHFRLLIGNYSRVGFFHPGPALLYVQAWGQLLFHDAVPLTRTAFGGHIVGILVLNAALVGTSAAIVARRARSWTAGVGLAVAVLMVVTFESGLLTSSWMPDVYVWPFLLLLVSAASVGSGEPRHLPLLALAVGLLVHGHISFVVIAGTIALLGVMGLVVSHLRAGTPGPGARTLGATGAVVALFALPIVLNLVLHWPGQFEKYWRYSRSSPGRNHGLADSARFVRDYWGHGASATALPLVLAALTVIAAVFVADRSARRFLLAAVGAVVAATGATIFYAWRGVDDLEWRYVAFFYYATEAVLYGTLVAAVILLATRVSAGRGTRSGRSLSIGAGAVLVVVGLVLAAQPGLSTPRGVTWPPAAYATIPGSRRLVAFHVGPDAWPQSAALLEYTRRQGRPACVDDAKLAVLFTDALICTPRELAVADGRVVVQLPGSVPVGRLLYADGSLVVSLSPR